jgi:hypothetical protein
MRETFQNKNINEIEERIKVETFCGSKILRVDGRRVGHAVDDSRVEAYRRFLATALPDLEQVFAA